MKSNHSGLSNLPQTALLCARCCELSTNFSTTSKELLLSSDNTNERRPLFSFQMEVLKQYLDGGGNVLVLLGEGGERKYDTNINFLLEEFGIMVNNGAY